MLQFHPEINDSDTTSAHIQPETLACETHPLTNRQTHHNTSFRNILRSLPRERLSSLLKQNPLPNVALYAFNLFLRNETGVVTAATPGHVILAAPF